MRCMKCACLLTATIAGCGTPSVDRTTPELLLEVTPMETELLGSTTLQAPGMASGSLERLEGDSRHLTWVRRWDYCVVGRVTAEDDGSLRLEGDPERIEFDWLATLESLTPGQMTGVFAKSNPAHAPKSQGVSWREGPEFFARMQVRGPYLCVEGRMQIYAPPPFGTSVDIVRIYERQEDGWKSIKTIHREPSSQPIFGATAEGCCVLTTSEDGLEIWKWDPDQGLVGERLANPGSFRECGLATAAHDILVCWNDGTDSFIDWGGLRVVVRGLRLTGESTVCSRENDSLAVFACDGGRALVLRKQGQRLLSMCWYPVADRHGTPHAVADGEDIVVWWQGATVIRDSVRLR